jgi:dihydroorotase
VSASILLKGGRVIDPRHKLDKRADVLVVDGFVAEVGPGLRAPQKGTTLRDVSDKIVTPGLVDLHVHLREPGQEYKEDIASGSRAAVAGGFTTMCCMPNTNPVNDCRSVTDLITRRAREVAIARVLPIGAITQGLKGEGLAEMGEMKDAGIVAVSDDGRPVMNAEVMRRAMEYARTFGLPVVQHAEDLNLAAGGVMHEGEWSTRLGLRGQPGAAESVMVARDIDLTALTGARYHVAHMSVARSADLVRDAKRRGLPVTCEVTPHHLWLTHAACCDYHTDTKMAPPLRTDGDVAALREALADGTIDCIATDHAPHSPVEKDLEFDFASFGVVGLETALPLSLELVEQGIITLPRMVELLTWGAVRCFGLEQQGLGHLGVGAHGDVSVIDPDARWTLDRARLRSKSKNTPFHGRAMHGRAILTVMGGRVVYDAAQESPE